MYIEEQTFDKVNFQGEPLKKGEYENCIFKQCDLSSTDLSDIKFTSCEFVDCNLSLAKLANTAFRDAVFKGCKMLGLHFDDCNQFGLSFSFDNCQLNHALFYKMIIKKTSFKNSQLHEVDFAECDLTGAVFDHCDLAGAVFDHTNLEKADFRTAYNYIIDPEMNRIKQARFSILGVSGLLAKYGIDIENNFQQ